MSEDTVVHRAISGQPADNSEPHQDQQQQDQLNHEESLTFDDVLLTRIGFGIYQIVLLAVMCLIDFLDGGEQYYVMILVQVLEKEWNLPSSETELLGSIYYFGLFIGAVLAGLLCDLIGRKNALQIGCALQVVTVTWTALAQTYLEMIFIRLMYGCVIGMTLPIGLLIMTELIPQNIRGRCLIVAQSAFLFGKFYLLLLGWIFMDDLSKGNWRAIAICQLFPTTCLALGTFFFIDDSPRFLVSKGNMEEALKILDKIGKQNQGENYQPLSQQEKDQLTRWRDQTFQNQPSSKEILKSLFKGTNFSISWRLILGQSANSFISSGALFLAPFYLHSTGQGFFELFIMTLGELPASLIVYLFIDKHQFGRLKIVTYSLLVCAVILFVVYLAEERFLLFGLASIKFFSRFTILCSNPLISESYDTTHRSIGVALPTAIGRSFGAVSPFVLYELYLYNKWQVFLVFSITAVGVFLLFLTYPIADSTSKPLDEQHKVGEGSGKKLGQDQGEKIKKPDENGLEEDNTGEITPELNVQFEENEAKEISPDLNVKFGGNDAKEITPDLNVQVEENDERESSQDLNVKFEENDGDKQNELEETGLLSKNNQNL